MHLRFIDRMRRTYQVERRLLVESPANIAINSYQIALNGVTLIQYGTAGSSGIRIFVDHSLVR
jgi:hypothetical protein